MVSLEAPLERSARSSYGRAGRFFSLPRAERVGPDVGLLFAHEAPDALLDGFFEKPPFGDAEPSRDPIHVVERGFVQAGGENLLHT